MLKTLKNYATTMAADYQASFEAVMKTEGGYVNDYTDRGGETYMGIARNKFPAWPGWLVIDKARNAPGFPQSLSVLTPAVQQFYKENFWDRNRLSEFKDASLALELFDTGINMGVATAAKFLQRSLNLLNRNGLSYPDTSVDGIIGHATITLTNNHKNPRQLYDLLNTMQGAKYIRICEADPTQEKYMYGWLTRT